MEPRRLFAANSGVAGSILCRAPFPIAPVRWIRYRPTYPDYANPVQRSVIARQEPQSAEYKPVETTPWRLIFFPLAARIYRWQRSQLIVLQANAGQHIARPRKSHYAAPQPRSSAAPRRNGKQGQRGEKNHGIVLLFRMNLIGASV